MARVALSLNPLFCVLFKDFVLLDFILFFVFIRWSVRYEKCRFYFLLKILNCEFMTYFFVFIDLFNYSSTYLFIFIHLPI